MLRYIRLFAVEGSKVSFYYSNFVSHLVKEQSYMRQAIFMELLVPLGMLPLLF